MGLECDILDVMIFETCMFLESMNSYLQGHC
jgi:hypothetical protein